MTKPRSRPTRKRKKTTTSTTLDFPHAAGARLVILALGANLPSTLGDPETTLSWAVTHLAARLTKPRVAALFESAPLAGKPQPLYLNTVLVGGTDDSAEAWLGYGKSLEREVGRRAGPRWGPRPLDIDIIALGATQRRNARLTLPHPELANRRFVLAPLAEILPGLQLPGFVATVAELLAAAPREPAVSRRPWRSDPIAQTGSG